MLAFLAQLRDQHEPAQVEKDQELRILGVKKIILTCVGVALILVGVPLLVLPGPGLLLIAVGIGILISQFRRPRTELPQLKGKSGADSDQPARGS